MWLISDVGFFSIVRKSGDDAGDMLTIRARVRGDLERLRQRYLPSMGPIVEGGGTDYRFRARALRREVGQAVAAMVGAIDYRNFKDRIASVQGSGRAHRYAAVWADLAGLEEEDAPDPSPPRGPRCPRPVDAALPSSGGAAAADDEAPQPWPAEQERIGRYRVSYGGVLIDSAGRVLLRKVKGGFGGTDWTFAKGRHHPPDEPAHTALREVREETGYAARIVGPIPGDFKGQVSITRYYLMRPVGEPGSFDDETEQVRWVEPEQARSLIATTPDLTTRQRDLAVLDAALACNRQTPDG